MKKSFILCLLMAVYFAGISQTETRTPQKIKEDKKGFEDFKKREPELFLNKRLPVKLKDGAFFVKGFGEIGVRLTNNHLVDSVYHNFHLGSTETGIIPYNNILVTESTASIDIIKTLVFTDASATDSSSITLLDTSAIQTGRLDNKAFHFGDNYSNFVVRQENDEPDSIAVKPISEKDIEIRISINGKLLFDWTSLYQFPKNIFKSIQKWPPTKKTGPFWVLGYGYGFHIADQPLAVNDQLLIEIKETKKGWMLDRFNITRVSVKPSIASIQKESNKGKESSTILLGEGPSEKKTFRSTPR